MGNEISIKTVLDALRQVDDPDLKKDIVSLKMVRDLVVTDQVVKFRLVLTTPACPLKDIIKAACVNAIHHLVSKDLDVQIELDAEVTAAHKSADALGGVKNLIAVHSGKGGVGKSTVAVNLAIGLAQKGAKVGLLDADIYGPSVPMLMGLRGQAPRTEQIGEKLRLYPIDKHGVLTMSVGLLLEENQALVWRGPMVTTALRQLLNDVAWGELDYLVVDLPPGTGDVHLTLAQSFPLSGVVIVTTPQEMAVMDTRKSIEMYRMPGLNIPILGLVQNMSYFSPMDFPDKKYRLFGENGGIRLANEYGIPVLAELPLYGSLAESADNGIPAVIMDDEQIGHPFRQMAERVAQQVSILVGNGPGPSA